MNPVLVSGNMHKVQYFNAMIGRQLDHVKLDIEEIQSLDLQEVVEHKARQAYKQAGRPVVVEDTRLVFNALGQLPGTYIKWFLQEVGIEGLCTMLASFDDRSAVAGAAIAYFDGSTLKVFESSVRGSIARTPLGSNGFGWNQIFVPEGSDLTLGQMSDAEFRHYYVQIKPFAKVSEFLASLDL